MMIVRLIGCILLLSFIASSCTSMAQDTVRTIHVVVALCDNKNQGINPVPEKIGNGQDPENNLYWGARYGVKTFFKKSAEWKFIKSFSQPQDHVLERVIFKHKASNTYLIADAYDGAKIKNATIDFLEYASGNKQQVITINNVNLNCGGNSNLIVYSGHNGLMDFDLAETFTSHSDKKREVMILACASKQYFHNFIKPTGAYPVIWTTNLMCPEAYTLKAAIGAWIENKTYAQIANAAASAYHAYQKCGLGAAKKLIVTGK